VSSAHRPLGALVVTPKSSRHLDVALLALLRAASQQNDQRVTVTSEIDPLSRSEINLVLNDAFAD